MKKQRISRILNTLETLGEIPKRAVADTLRTFNPLDALKPSEGQTPNAEATPPSPKEVPENGHATPLKVEKVAGQHELNDLSKNTLTAEQQKLAALRARLFSQVKDKEMGAIKEQEQKEQEVKQEEMTEEQRKQEALQRRLASHQDGDIPQGREKRGGLGVKKKKRTSNAVMENQAEMRGSGKH